MAKQFSWLFESVPYKTTADKDIESILWEREKNWQSQLFTNTYGMNSMSDLYSKGKKD